MKPVALLVVLGVAVASNAMAQSSANQFPPAPPPPGMNDPGVKAVTPPRAPASSATPSPSSAQSSKSNQSASADTSAPMSQSASSYSAQPRDANGQTPPQVTVHRQGEDTVQEYRRSGQLYMVVVTPASGIPQTYMVDQKGAWTNQAGEPIKPVMYKVIEWGNSKSAADQDNGGK